VLDAAIMIVMCLRHFPPMLSVLDHPNCDL
jgi:hypothetical protein